jgi:protocatechuate 3,4-dioxygenase beta subunit
MRPLLVLLLVALAAVAFFFALNAGEREPSAPAQMEGVRPDAAPAVEPTSLTTLSEPDAAGNRIEAPGVSATQTRVAHPSARIGNELLGRVVNSDREPVEGAEVVLTQYGPYDSPLMLGGGERVPDRQTITNAEGRFSFPDLDTDIEHSILAAHPDHGRRIESHLTLADGEVSEELLVVLQPGSSVHGTITDTGGNLIDGALVRLSTFGVGNQDEGAGIMLERTDATGRYSFPNISEGNYSLTVEAQGYGKIQFQRLQVSGDGEVVQDVQLEVAHLIAGKLRDEDSGTPVVGAKVEAYSTDRSNETTNTHTLSDGDGNFEFGDVREGSYTLLVRASGYGVHREPRVSTGDVTLELELKPLPTIEGVVLNSQGTPLDNFVVQLRQIMLNLDQSSTEPNQSTPVPDTKVEVEANAGGAFRIACSRKGQFIVEATHPRFAASFSEPFFVEEGSNVTGLMVRMTSGGTLFGVVLDGQGNPLAGARVKTHHTDYVDDPFWRSLGDAYPSAAARKQVRTDSSGNFELTELTAETYQLHIDHPDYAETTLRDLAVEEGARVKVGPVRLKQGASISGTVYGPAGTGMPGTRVQVQLDAQVSGDRYGAFYTARSNAEGRYSFHHLPPGLYKISVQRQGRSDNPFVGMTDQKATRRPVTLADGESYTQDFTLSN